VADELFLEDHARLSAQTRGVPQELGWQAGSVSKKVREVIAILEEMVGSWRAEAAATGPTSTPTAPTS
jgi:hypothetical protein